jgi:hypothetical protein
LVCYVDGCQVALRFRAATAASSRLLSFLIVSCLVGGPRLSDVDDGVSGRIPRVFLESSISVSSGSRFSRGTKGMSSLFGSDFFSTFDLSSRSQSPCQVPISTERGLLFPVKTATTANNNGETWLRKNENGCVGLEHSSQKEKRPNRAIHSKCRVSFFGCMSLYGNR